MSVRVKCNQPESLLAEIRTFLRGGKNGDWTVDSDGDFTHTTEHLRTKAWFRPKISEGEIAFYILAPRGNPITSRTYAIYHGRFIEMLLESFDSRFDRATASALPERGDIIRHD